MAIVRQEMTLLGQVCFVTTPTLFISGMDKHTRRKSCAMHIASVHVLHIYLLQHRSLLAFTPGWSILNSCICLSLRPCMPPCHGPQCCGHELLTASCADSGHGGCLQIDQPGSAIDAYIGGLREVLERKASNIAQLQGRLESFQVI